jgi:hypothetical protein
MNKPHPLKGRPSPLRGRPSPLKGRPSPLKGRSERLAWLKQHVTHEGDGCLIWPFWRDPDHGRGRVWVDGRLLWAPNYMCTLAHGAAPADRPQAAHSCGNGHLGCIHPGHLSWKSNSENQRDRREHGRPEGAIGPRTRLSPEQVSAIREMKGKVPQFTLAKLVGVKRGTIEYWQRHDRPPVPRKYS